VRSARLLWLPKGSLAAVPAPSDDAVVVLHNPRCSKSRGALEILGIRGVDAEVIQYLDTPPDRALLERILDAIPDDPSALVRHDSRFKELGLDAKAYGDRDAVVGLLLEHPELMERPVVFVGERAVIARPPEKVLDLLG
jgi:arsenate reductase